MKETLPSGSQTTLRNRVGCARTYLLKFGLIEQSKRECSGQLNPD
ncbi:winged helix-turn-helix domain-containing protein [Aeromonas veronii]